MPYPAAIVSFTAPTSCFSVKGLGRNENCSPLRQALFERLLGIARDEDDLQLRIALAKLLEQRRAVHLRHHHVGDDEVDRAAVLLEHFHGLDAVLGLEHGVAARFQAAGVERAKPLLVLDQQDRAGAGEIGGGRRRGLGRRG